MAEPSNPRPGEHVLLIALPPGLLDGLPAEDQRAISAIVGKPVTLLGHHGLKTHARRS